jgi:hypothetical protein
MSSTKKKGRKDIVQVQKKDLDKKKFVAKIVDATVDEAIAHINRERAAAGKPPLK